MTRIPDRPPATGHSTTRADAAPAPAGATREPRAQRVDGDLLEGGARPGRHVEISDAASGTDASTGAGLLGLLGAAGEQPSRQDVGITPVIAARLRARFGAGSADLSRLPDGRYQLTDAEGATRLAFVSRDGEVYEVSPFAFTVTADLVAQLRQAHGELLVKDIDTDGNGLVTEDELWDYFSFEVQRDHAAFREISDALAAQHPALMRFMADRDLQAAGARSDRVEGEFRRGLGDIREHVAAQLQQTADLLGKPVAALSDLERFNTAVRAYRELGVQYDQPAPGEDLVLAVGRRRDQAGTFSASEVFADRSTPAICLEQSYLMALMLREAGLEAAVNLVGTTSPASASAFGTHTTIAVDLDGQRCEIEPQAVNDMFARPLFADGDARPWRERVSGAEVLELMQGYHQGYGLTAPLNDKEALAIGFSNAAWFDFTRALHDDALAPPRRAKLLARGQEHAALAGRMSTRAIEVPGVALMGDLVAHATAGDPAPLERAVTRADQQLAQPHWRPEERLWLLAMKAEALELLGRDTTEVVTAIDAVEGARRFTYQPLLLDAARARALGERLAPSSALVIEAG